MYGNVRHEWAHVVDENYLSIPDLQYGSATSREGFYQFRIKS